MQCSPVVVEVEIVAVVVVLVGVVVVNFVQCTVIS